MPITPLSDADKEMILSEALSTPEGRSALAEAMVEPVRGGYSDWIKEIEKENLDDAEIEDNPIKNRFEILDLE
ncbi:MAG: hypothetical protein ABGF52_11370 [Candidatus Asgardarchaeum sp.]